MAGATAGVTGEGVRGGGGLVSLCARLLVQGGPKAQGVGRAIHTACGAERVGVTAGTASGTAFLKRQAHNRTAAKHFACHNLKPICRLQTSHSPCSDYMTDAVAYQVA